MKKISYLIFVWFLSIVFSFWFTKWQYDPIWDTNAVICSICTDEWFSYTQEGKCEIPMFNPITNSFGTTLVDCTSVTPCISLWWEYYGGWQCCLWDDKLVIDNNCRTCDSLSSEELLANPGRCWEDTCPTDRKIKWWCCDVWETPYDKETIWSEFTKCCNWILYNDDKSCCEKWSVVRWNEGNETCVSCSLFKSELDGLVGTQIPWVWQITEDWSFYKWELAKYTEACSDDPSACWGEMYDAYDWTKKCCVWTLVNDMEHDWFQACIVNTEWNMWINMNKDCLINWQCSYNIYETLWIRKSDPNPSVGGFVQDFVLAATTFIGTVVALVLVTSGILYIIASITWNSTLADKAKKWIIWSIMGIVLVAWSYALVRLIQFFATAGWW